MTGQSSGGTGSSFVSRDIRGSVGSLAAAFRAAVVYATADRRRLGATAVGGAAVYVLLLFATAPTMTWQMLSADLRWLDETIVLLTQETYAVSGTVGLLTAVAYAALSGVALTNVAARVRYSGSRSAGGLAGVLPGVLASGCAACGAGVLGLLGLTGALAVFPFGGLLVRLGGLALLVGYLSHAGDPRECAF
jgi:hypothetical protein